MKLFFSIFLFSITIVSAAFSADDLKSTLFEPDGPSIALADISGPSLQPGIPHQSVAGKSRGKALLLSLLVPGLGQRYTGKNTRANIYLATEVTLWLGYLGFTRYREWRKEDYKAYAAAHAGVDLTGKSDSYFIDVENYASIYDYNAAKLRQRNLPKYYRDVEHYYWQWDSEANRKRYEQLRISADTADNRALFVIGAVLANHVVSAIDAVWSAHNANKAARASLQWNVRFGDGKIQPNILISMSKNF